MANCKTHCIKHTTTKHSKTTNLRATKKAKSNAEKLQKNHFNLRRVHIPTKARKQQHRRSIHNAHLPYRTYFAWARHPNSNLQLCQLTTSKFSLFCSQIDFNQCNAPTPMTRTSTRSRCRHKAHSTETANPHDVTQHKQKKLRRSVSFSFSLRLCSWHHIASILLHVCASIYINTHTHLYIHMYVCASSLMHHWPSQILPASANWQLQPTSPTTVRPPTSTTFFLRALPPLCQTLIVCALNALINLLHVCASSLCRSL